MKETLIQLRHEMEKENVAALIIPTSDPHSTEYVCEHFAARKFVSGFTGSAGVLVVCKDCAALWTDGRYFLQAESQLAGSGIDLMKIGQAETPAIEDYIVDHCQAGETVAFDGRLITVNQADTYAEAFEAKQLHMMTDIDFVDRIWTDRPAMPDSQTFLYDVKYAGKSVADKLAEIQACMNKAEADHLILTKIDEIAWLLNLRAKDIPYYPVALAYMIVHREGGTLYINQARLDEESRACFEKNHIEMKDYEAIYDDVSGLQGFVWLDPNSANIRLALSLQTAYMQEESPIIERKARKNPVEIASTKQAHLKDGVAVTKFMYWLKHTDVSKESELSVSDKLQSFRQAQENYIEDSFAPIVAYGPHGAIIHYQSSIETNVSLKPEGFLMIDSGGQYIEGTTDITRTYVLGPISEKQRHWFSVVLRGHIRLEMAHWIEGCTGSSLDILAHGPIWDEQMDYQHGTGHGVGHLSSVHEGPQSIRWRGQGLNAVIRPGMITSDEPGIYIPNEFGIRHENEVLAVADEKNFYGQFMHFEPLTWVPFDVDGLDVSLFQKNEIAWLNDYHQKVYATISPYLDADEKAWLEKACSPISK